MGLGRIRIWVWKLLGPNPRNEVRLGTAFASPSRPRTYRYTRRAGIKSPCKTLARAFIGLQFHFFRAARKSAARRARGIPSSITAIFAMPKGGHGCGSYYIQPETRCYCNGLLATRTHFATFPNAARTILPGIPQIRHFPNLTSRHGELGLKSAAQKKLRGKPAAKSGAP